MQKLMLSAIVFAVFANTTANAWQNEEDAAIGKRHEEFVAAWNKHDGKALAAMFTKDGDVINPFGKRAKGTAELEKLFSDEHAGPMANSKYAGKIAGIRYIGKDVAIVDVDAEISGMKGADGAAVPPFKHHVTWIAVKEGGKWVAVGARAFATLSPPSAPPK